MLKVILTDGTPAPARMRGNRLEVQTVKGTEDDFRGRLRAWYRVRGRDYLSRRIDALAKSLPWVDAPPPYRLLEMSRQWGSCSPSGEIIINPHLVKAPPDCIDYVLIHEMAHLKHHDHGPAFWNLIEAYASDWRKKKRQLDELAEIILSV